MQWGSAVTISLLAAPTALKKASKSTEGLGKAAVRVWPNLTKVTRSLSWWNSNNSEKRRTLAAKEIEAASGSMLVHNPMQSTKQP